jgi:hypothetical protein
MTGALLMGLLVGPIVLMTVLRINAAMVFLSICLGSVLLQFVGPDALSLVGLFTAHGSSIGKSTVQLVLVLLPVILTALFMIRSVHGKKIIVNIFPAVSASVLLLLVIQPLLSDGVRGTITATSWWPQLNQSSDLIIGIGALMCLLYLWTMRQKSHADHKKPR